MAEIPHREPLSSIDTAWFRMETETNQADIGAVLGFDEPLEFDRVRALCSERLVEAFPRFRQRVVKSTAGLRRPRWERDPEFSLERHVHRETLPEPGGAATLQRRVGELLSDGLDLEMPLWQVYQFDNYRGGSALFAHIHHCLGDGFALARVLLSIADQNWEAEASVADESRDDRPLSQRLRRAWHRLVDFAGGSSRVAEGIRDIADELRYIATMPFDTRTRLKRPLSGRLRVGWSEPHSLDRLKEIAHGWDATLNDVLMAAVTETVRKVLLEAGDDVDAARLRSVVPVNLRPAQRIEEMEPVLGNEFGLVFLDLPTGTDSLDERLARLEASIDELKESPEALVTFAILTAEGSATAPVEKIVSEIFGRKASLVVSNVPGPRERLRVAGEQLEELMFMVPHPGPTVGLGISLISYAGDVRLGVRVDEAICSDATRIVGWLEEAFEELASHT